MHDYTLNSALGNPTETVRTLLGAFVFAYYVCEYERPFFAYISFIG